MTDDTTGAEPKVSSASFADPYVLLLRDDTSILVLKADESGDLDEIEQAKASRKIGWLSGSLYEDSNDVLRLETDDETEDEAGNVLMFLLNTQGGLEVGHFDPARLMLGNTERKSDLSTSKHQQAGICCQRSQFPPSVLIRRVYDASLIWTRAH